MSTITSTASAGFWAELGNKPEAIEYLRILLAGKCRELRNIIERAVLFTGQENKLVTLAGVKEALEGDGPLPP